MAQHSTDRRMSRKKRIAIVTIGFLAISGVASAFWTAGGDGTGSVSTAGETQRVTVNQTTLTTDLEPGATVALAGSFDNPNAGSVKIDQVTAVIGDVTKGGDLITDDCVDDYSVIGSSNTPGVVPAGAAQGSWSGLSVTMADTNVNQDACKGADVEIVYTAVAGS